MKLRLLAILILFLPALALYAQGSERNETTHSPVFTWGARVGFAATGTYITDAHIDGHKLTEYTQDTQVGNFAGVLFRLNSKKLVLQTGLGLNFNKSSFYLDRNSWNPESESKDVISCSYSMLSLTIPIQGGFHIVNRDQYCMTAFTGPRLRYSPDKYYSVKYSQMDPYDFTDQSTELILGWSLGLSVQIGRTFLDFEYEATINNVSGPMFDTSGATPAPDYKLNRRAGIISFSYGIML